MTIIPRLTLFAKAGLQGPWASIIPVALSGFGIVMMRQSMDTIPDSVLEAARIDGATEIYILHRIAIPMSMNANSALAIFMGGLDDPGFVLAGCWRSG